MKKETRERIRQAARDALISTRIWMQDHPRASIGIAAFCAGALVGWLLA